MAYTNIDDPSAYFKAVKYTGNGTEPRNIDVGFQSDFIWTKDRTVGYHHRIFDSSRGNVGPLHTNNTSVEDGYNDGPEIDFSSPHSNGFKIIDNPDGTTNSYGVNVNNSEIISWNWRANSGTTASNTDGSITTTTQVNSDAGFSIVSWAGGGTGSLGHGLGVVPDMWIVKNRDYAVSWAVGFSDASILGGTSNYLSLNTTQATLTYNNIWGSSPANSSTITMAGDRSVNISGDDYVGYFFKAKQGYSKFGKYVGNSNTNGAFIYTGFKPAFVLLKESSNSGNGWFLLDSTRDESNTSNSAYLRADEAGAEGSSKILDLLSNGFKLRNNDNAVNGTGRTYIYIAFAENPFVTSTGVPTTAR